MKHKLELQYGFERVQRIQFKERMHVDQIMAYEDWRTTTKDVPIPLLIQRNFSKREVQPSPNNMRRWSPSPLSSITEEREARIRDRDPSEDRLSVENHQDEQRRQEYMKHEDDHKQSTPREDSQLAEGDVDVPPPPAEEKRLPPAFKCKADEFRWYALQKPPVKGGMRSPLISKAGSYLTILQTFNHRWRELSPFAH